ncbi:acyltransferase family protein [Nonlabens xiamenensis]|uniref:acyltransferase family protein n=1 Tax=Nonlabens xiamenensis TaxID=2341043 RepID=UPI000F60ADAF|nr:acyltransferase [Nonlabens xiamenensis]
MEIKQLHPLTSLRFVFALMVFFSHLAYLEESQNEGLQQLYTQVFSQGYIGVGFFFILSGFILTHVYSARWQERKQERRKFYILRIARIYPLHLLTLLVAAPLMLYNIVWGPELLAISVSNLTLTQAFIPDIDYNFSYNGVSWSISCELFFYLCFPFLLLWWRQLKALKYFLFFILTALLLVLMITIPASWHNSLFYVHPLSRILDFILGIFLYELYRYIKRINFSTMQGSFLELGGISLLVLFFCFRESVPDSFLHSIYYWIPMCVIIATFSLQRGYISQLLSRKPAIWLGEISFGFYMWHHLVLRYFHAINRRLNFMENEIVIGLTCLFFTILIAGCSFQYFERPSNKWVRTFLK